jgi:hypothetical protein
LETFDVACVPVDLLKGKNIRVREQLPHDMLSV